MFILKKCLLRSAVLCIAITMFFALTTGCKSTPTVSSSSSSSSVSENTKKVDFGGKEVIFTYPWPLATPESSSAAERADKKRQDLEKQYNVKITNKSVNGNYYSAKMVSSILSGKPMGSFLVCPGIYTADYFKSEIFTDLTAAMEETKINFEDPLRYNQHVLQYTNLNGKQIGLNSGYPGLTDIWVFNKRMLAEANIDIYKIFDDGQWTFDKVEEIAKLLTKDTDNDGVTDVYGLGTQMTEFLAFSLSVSNGGSMMKIDPKSNLPVLSWNDPASREALNTMYKWSVTDKILGFSKGGAWTQGATDFANGKYAIIQCSIDYLSTLRSIPMKDEYGIVGTPKGPKTKGGYVSATYNMSFSFIPVTYQNDAANLLVLFDALNISSKQSWLDSTEPLVCDEESLKNMGDILFTPDRLVFEPSTVFGIEWAEPSFAMCIQDICVNNQTVGAAIDKYSTQFVSLINDKWKDIKFTGDFN